LNRALFSLNCSEKTPEKEISKKVEKSLFQVFQFVIHRLYYNQAEAKSQRQQHKISKQSK